MTSWTLALALLAAFPLVGCSAVSPEAPNTEEAYEESHSVLEVVREASIDVLAATPDDAPCRAEWRRLAAAATDTLQRARTIYANNLAREYEAGATLWDRPFRRAARSLAWNNTVAAFFARESDSGFRRPVRPARARA